MTLKKNKLTREGKPLNDLQRLASTENWALFQLRGMMSNLIHLRKCNSIPETQVDRLRCEIERAVKNIKDEQELRKQERKTKPHG